ncbi:MAG: hypothetical protein WEB57_00495 [Pseudohongiellaceae bacterium]
MTELTGARPEVPEPDAGNTWIPKDRDRLTRFLLELDAGELSPEMARWWWDRY